MKVTERYGLRPRLDVCGVIGIFLGLLFTGSLIVSLGADLAHWLVTRSESAK